MHIHTISGVVRKLICKPTDTVAQIKEMLYAEEGIEPEHQRILFRGSIAPDTATLQSLGIKKEDHFHSVINLKGGF